MIRYKYRLSAFILISSVVILVSIVSFYLVVASKVSSGNVQLNLEEINLKETAF